MNVQAHTVEQAIAPAVEQFESGAAAKAFASLPERWQLVLWHLEVENQKPADIAKVVAVRDSLVRVLRRLLVEAREPFAQDAPAPAADPVYLRGLNAEQREAGGDRSAVTGGTTVSGTPTRTSSVSLRLMLAFSLSAAISSSKLW